MLHCVDQACVSLLEKMSAEKMELQRRLKDSGTDGDALSLLASPAAADFTRVSLAFTEVLQLQVDDMLFIYWVEHYPVHIYFTRTAFSVQNRPKEALQVLGKAIEELNTDLVYAKKFRSGSMGSDATSATPPGGGQQVVEFDHLKKMKALCHRRIG
jgi:hypothetical protein